MWLSLVERHVRDSITVLGVEFSRRAESPWKHWLFRLSRMSKNHQFLGLTTCLTTYKKSNIFTISRCSEGGIAHRSGRWDRRFESCHFDQKTAENKLFWLVFGCFSICFSQNRLFSVDHMFALIFNLWTAFLPWFSLCFKKSLFFAYCDANFEGWQITFCQPSFLSSRQIGICLFVFRIQLWKDFA